MVARLLRLCHARSGRPDSSPLGDRGHILIRSTEPTSLAQDTEPKPKPAPLGVGRGRGQRAHGDGRGGRKREYGLLHRVFPPWSGLAGADRLATILKPVPAPVKEAGLKYVGNLML